MRDGQLDKDPALLQIDPLLLGGAGTCQATLADNHWCAPPALGPVTPGSALSDQKSSPTEPPTTMPKPGRLGHFGIVTGKKKEHASRLRFTRPPMSVFL